MNKKTLLLSSLSILSIGATATALALTNSSVSLSLDSNHLAKSFSPNEGQKDRLVNPDEVFYMSPVLTPNSYPIVNSDDSINQDNVNQWKYFSENLKNISLSSSLPSQVSSIVNSLKSIGTEIDKTVQLRETLATNKQNWIDSNKDTWPENILGDLETFWVNNIRPQIISQMGAQENIDTIPGINDIQNNLLILSGITSGNKIATLTNYSNDSFKSLNLSQQNASSQSLSIGNVAGVGYSQLIKIAELNSSTAGTYALSFSFRSSTSTFSQSGTLYIKNDNNQLSSASTIDDLIKNLDVFGRWDIQNFNSLDDSFKTFNNFVIQKNSSGNWEILVRIKDNDLLTDIEFLTAIEGVTSQLLSPSSFGILDVQADENSTFRSKIEATGDKKLVEDPSTIKPIQFFSKYFTSSRVNSTSDILFNRKLEFYQGPSSSEVLLGLNYANNIGFEDQSSVFNYDPIILYTNGVSTGRQEMISLVANGNSASWINGSESNSYDLFSELRSQLPSQITDDNFAEASTIKLSSYLDTSSKITKQSFTYSDYFYAIGNRKNSDYSGVNAVNSITFEMEDPTQKMFFERPNSFPENVNSITPEDSSIKANVSVDEQAKTLSILGDVYYQFSRSNSGDFNGRNFSLGEVSLWTASNNKNFKTEAKNISGSARSIYDELNNNWSLVSWASNNLFGASTKNDRYLVTNDNVNLAKDIVQNYLANRNNSASLSQVNEIINNSIEIIKTDGSNSGSITESTSYTSLSSDSKNKLADNVAKLIKLQFGIINDEFVNQQYTLIFNNIKSVVESSNTSEYKVFNASDDILELYTSPQGINLIKYKNGAWNNASENKKVTMKEAISALFDVLYFTNDEGIVLGQSIFSTNQLASIFASLDSNALTTFELSSDTIYNKVRIYNQILNSFGGNLDLLGSISDSLKNGTKFNLDENRLQNALQLAISNVADTTNSIRKNNPNSENVSSYYLDDLISGTNAIICLNWKLNQIQQSPSSLYSTREASDSQELLDKINTILNDGNAQFSANELSIWSNIINDTYNFSNYSSDLSGRNGNDSLDKMSEALTNDENILKSRSTDSTSAAIAVQNVLKYLWWIVVALIGVGVLVASTVGVSTKDRQVKLSSRPVLKWLLISGIVLGLAVAVLAIVIGVVL